jgi:hypothetical protein
MGNYRDAGNKEALHPEHEPQSSGDAEVHTPLQTYYLRLLEHRINLKNSYGADPNREEWLLKVINRAAYATFRACVEQGAEAEAKTLLKGEHSED